MWSPFRKKSSLFKVDIDYSGPPNKIPLFWIANIPDVNIECQWCVGAPMPYPLPPTIIHECDKNVPLKDLMDEAGGPILVSDRLAKLITRMSSCAVCYDSEVHYKGKVIRRDCKTVKFEANFDCLNMSASKFRNRIPVRHVVAEDKIPIGEHIFRINECLTVACDRVFIDEVESLGMTGFGFKQLWRT